MSAAPPPPEPLPAWQTCLDIEGQEAGHYLDFANEALLRAIDGEPASVLDVGCAGGRLGALIKERNPRAHVTGIEAGRAAAERAATRLDRVICSRLESVDFAAQGIGPGAYDLVIAGDVLEHLVNPWTELVRLRPLIAPGGQLVACIPNVRNLQVLQLLADRGRFHYEERGLLDVTHLRFFAFNDMRYMFETTGYRVEAYLFTISRALQQLYAENKGKAELLSITVGRITLADVTQRDLGELCAEQYIIRVRPEG